MPSSPSPTIPVLRPQPRSRSQAWLPLLLAALIIAAASHVRLARLGAAQFSMDEATHYFAARSLEQGRGPLLPSGKPYVRGVDLARVTAWIDSDRLGHEFALRLPGAVFGVVSLLLFLAVAWPLVGPWAAVWALLLFACFPELIAQSRNGRFYTYQICFIVPALYTGWRTLRACSERELRGAWIWAAASAALLLLGARVQIVTLSAAVGFGLAVACVAAVHAVESRGLDWKHNAALQLIAAGAAGLAVLVAVRPEFVAATRHMAFYVPLWAGSTPGDPRQYHWALCAAIPLFYGIAPASFAWLILRDWRLGVLLLCWFGVPFVLHSLVLPWKGERFLLPALPGLFLASGAAAAAACAALRRATDARLAGLGLAPWLARSGAAGVVAVAALFAIATTPAVTEARKIPEPAENFDWRAASERIARESGASPLPIGSSMPLPALVYFGRLDFTMGTDFLEDEVDGEVRAGAQGMIDGYSGTPVLTTPQSIRARFAGAEAVLIVIDPLRLKFANIDPELDSALRAEARELCEQRCGGLLLYRWPLGTRPVTTP